MITDFPSFGSAFPPLGGYSWCEIIQRNPVLYSPIAENGCTARCNRYYIKSTSLRRGAFVSLLKSGLYGIVGSFLGDVDVVRM